MMLGGAVIALWVLTFLADYMMKGDDVENDIETVVESIDPAPAPTTPPPTQVAAITPDFSDVENKVKTNSDGVQKISENIEQQSSAIEKAHQKFDILSSKVNKMANEVSDLHYQFNHILDIDRELFQKLEAIEAKMKKAEEEAKKKLEAKVVKKPLKNYFIRAVVEGRAWLVDKSGNSMTISVGDQVPDYGKVEKIYSAQGFIVTSSGRIIQFPHD